MHQRLSARRAVAAVWRPWRLWVLVHSSAYLVFPMPPPSSDCKSRAADFVVSRFGLRSAGPIFARRWTAGVGQGVPGRHLVCLKLDRLLGLRLLPKMVVHVAAERAQCCWNVGSEVTHNICGVSTPQHPRAELQLMINAGSAAGSLHQPPRTSHDELQCEPNEGCHLASRSPWSQALVRPQRPSGPSSSTRPDPSPDGARLDFCAPGAEPAL